MYLGTLEHRSGAPGCKGTPEIALKEISPKALGDELIVDPALGQGRGREEAPSGGMLGPLFRNERHPALRVPQEDDLAPVTRYVCPDGVIQVPVRQKDPAVLSMSGVVPIAPSFEFHFDFAPARRVVALGSRETEPEVEILFFSIQRDALELAFQYCEKCLTPRAMVG